MFYSTDDSVLMGQAMKIAGLHVVFRQDEWWEAWLKWENLDQRKRDAIIAKLWMSHECYMTSKETFREILRDIIE